MIKKVKILLAEDDYNLGLITKKRLEEAGHDVTHVTDGAQAFQTFMKSHFDLCLLDIVMPKMSGIELAVQIRKRSELIPILFLTAKHHDEDKFTGFKSGGDDYITKPFSMQELLLRIDVHIKRSYRPGQTDNTVYSIAGLQFNYTERRILDKTGKVLFDLTAREADLIKFFADNPNKIIKREEILYRVWGKDDYFLGRSMDVFMTKVRKRFAGAQGVSIETIHGIGFKFIVK